MAAHATRSWVGWRAAALVLGLALAALSTSPAGAGPLRIMTTTEDLAAIASAVGGEAVEVSSLSRGFQDPHYVAAKPSLSRKLHEADLLVYVGLQLEIGWLPLLIRGARNPDVRFSQSGNLAAAAGIEILEVPAGTVDRAEGDIHPEGNPHYWLDPRNGAVIARTIATRLTELRPDRAELFAANLESFENELSQRMAGWEERLAPYRDIAIVAYHKQWEYLIAWAGFDVVGYIENRPGIPPSPRHIQQLVERMQARDVRLVIHADFINRSVPEEVALRAGARAVALPASVGSRPGIRDFFSLFDAIVKSIEEAMHSG